MTVRVYADERIPPRRNPEKCREIEQGIASMRLSGPPVMTDAELAEFRATYRDNMLGRRSKVYGYTSPRGEQ